LPHFERGTLTTDVGEKHLIALGKITVNFQLVEHHLAKLIWALLASDLEVARTVTAELSFRTLVAVASSLYRLRVSKPASISAMEDVMRRACKAEEKRNTMIHSTWIAGDPSEDPGRLKSTAKLKHGLKHHYEEVPVKDLERIATDLSEVAFDLVTLEMEFVPRS
jgi:hypothetical protein